MTDVANLVINSVRLIVDGARVASQWYRNTRSVPTYLSECNRSFEDGITLLLSGLDEDHDFASANIREGNRTQDSAWSTDIVTLHLTDVCTAISAENRALAKPSFRVAQILAARLFFIKACCNNDKLRVLKVGIQSTFFLHMDQPRVAAVPCMIFLEMMNSLPYISNLFSLHLKKVKNAEGDYESYKFAPLTTVATANYFVFHFIEKYARNVLNVRNWPRLKVSKNLFVHPIRSVGFRTLTEQIQESAYGIEPKSISFSTPIDATEMAVNSEGKFIIIGLDQSKETVVYMYSNSGEFEYAVRPTEEELDGKLFQPFAVFTDNNDEIYVYSRKSRIKSENASLFIFNKDGKLHRIVSVEHGFMALEKLSGKIFISSENEVFVYKKSGELLRSFTPPEALKGSASPVAVYDENTIIQADLYLPESNIYLVNDTGNEIKHFQAKQATGWKYIAFNSVSGEILVSYLAKDLTRFQLDAYFQNGQFLGRIDLPNDYSSHPRSLNVTPCGRIAVLYDNLVHVI